MELKTDDKNTSLNYKQIMDIREDEIDPLLHTQEDKNQEEKIHPLLNKIHALLRKDNSDKPKAKNNFDESKKIETKQALAIHFIKKIENRVELYRRNKRIGLSFFIVLFLWLLKLNFAELFRKRIYIMINSFSRKPIFKKPDPRLLLFIKICLLSLISIMILENTPKYDFLLRIGSKTTGRFIQDIGSAIILYIITKIPFILFVIFCVFIFEFIVRYIVFRIEKSDIPELRKNSIQSGITLVRILIIIFAIIFISPNLPAADTIYFKGISAFIVLAFSWSASSVFSDLAAGIILIFFSSLKTKDWIKVGDNIGEIRNQNLLFHQIKTEKNCILTIPNSVIFNSLTTNFSTYNKYNRSDPIKSKEEKLILKETEKLILHISVGLGYDLERDLVENTLIAAAVKTENILKDGKYIPFVRVTNLGDFAVTYELNVYTEKPEFIPQIYSDLQKKVQDECILNDIEILSPSYLALRNGTPKTIPEK